MRKKLHLLIGILCSSFGFGQVVITPFPYEIDQETSITITVDPNSSLTDSNGFNNPAKVYLHSGVGTDANPWIHAVGNWGQDDGVGEMTLINGLWSITFVPKDYYGLSSSAFSSITKMGMVFRNEDGTQQFKDNGGIDFLFKVGSFQLNLTSPEEGSTTIINSGEEVAVAASNTDGNATYTLKTQNGDVVNTQSSISSYNYTITNITENDIYTLEVTKDGKTISRDFNVIVDPGTINETMPLGLKNGINRVSASDAILVLDAPNKDFVYVAGSFNGYHPNTTYAMKKDAVSGKFWLSLTGLNASEIYNYQYWVVDKTPIANSPSMVKTADPFSTLVLSPFDDPSISAATYPNMPTYPNGQEREVTVLQTEGDGYTWQVNNFVKPKKEDLIVYEVLVRDFDADRNYQDLIDKMAYFKGLNINAIELMPVMEFEGNESWGYNTSFHMALDKAYGTAAKFKELVDVCHQNGIAVILDIALNHAFGRNPLVRMWMNDADGDGWGEPSSENPYFNEAPKHSYNVGSDFNHQQVRTQAYVKQVVEYWIEEFKIDGYRWDLTKGFTQNCTESGESCTNAYQQDRVDILKQYADYQWDLDPTQYVIFEHLGTNNEEQQWANYRVDGESDGVSKGIMMWGKVTDAYNQLTMGYSNNADISAMDYRNKGFSKPRLLGYAESHDEERLMYQNLTFGNSALSSHDVKDLDVSLSRMSAHGASLITIPGPKMIWHFAELGMENSIYTCNSGVVNTPSDSVSGDCKLDTKPQPQWVNNWMQTTARKNIYDDWARLIELKIEEPVFEGDFSISPDGNNIKQRIYIWDDNIASSELKNVVVLSNFSVANLSLNPNFPYAGRWYDLMDVTGQTYIDVNNTTDEIAINAGQFKIYGNQPSIKLLSNDRVEKNSSSVNIQPNPNSGKFQLTIDRASTVVVYDMTGRLLKSFQGDFNSETFFDVSELEKGIYVLKIKKDNISFVERLVKQ
ncbi:alpha-amylase family glycosyl hydrolase [Wenyingzhuangia marina]|nr:alpha-amylase family glycosyl hydrolase [Wenyingzhuangia marina]